MGTLVDTSFLIGVGRGARALELEGEHAIAAITAAELLHGSSVLLPRNERATKRSWRDCLREVPTIPFTLAIAAVR